jgi:hypothetical protein
MLGRHVDTGTFNAEGHDIDIPVRYIGNYIEPCFVNDTYVEWTTDSLAFVGCF